MPTISVIIPTRNEEGNVAKLMSQLIDLNSNGCSFDVVFADDSTDNTPVLAESLGARVVKGRGLGLAQAVLDGIDATDTDYIIVMDADLQHPPSLIPEIINQLHLHDLVVVTKHNKQSMDDLSINRKLQSILGVWAAQMLVPVPISDPMTGFFGIRRKCLEGIPRAGIYYQPSDKVVYPNDWESLDQDTQQQWLDKVGIATGTVKLAGIEAIGFKIGLELFAKAKWVSHSEIPMSFANREAGESKGTAHSLQRHLWRLYNNSLDYEVELPKGSEEYHIFYEANEMQKKWKRDIAFLLQDITKELQVKDILDVGCGSSPNINFMEGETRTGIDIREEALSFMREHSRATFVKGSVLDIPMADESYDFVSCIEVIEHLFEDDVLIALQELSRVVKPGGYLVLATPNYDSRLWRMVETTQRLFQKGEWTEDHHTRFNRNLLIGRCSRFGLKEIRYDTVMNGMDMVITFQKKYWS